MTDRIIPTEKSSPIEGKGLFAPKHVFRGAEVIDVGVGFNEAPGGQGVNVQRINGHYYTMRPIEAGEEFLLSTYDIPEHGRYHHFNREQMEPRVPNQLTLESPFGKQTRKWDTDERTLTKEIEGQKRLQDAQKGIEAEIKKQMRYFKKESSAIELAKLRAMAMEDFEKRHGANRDAEQQARRLIRLQTERALFLQRQQQAFQRQQTIQQQQYELRRMRLQRQATMPSAGGPTVRLFRLQGGRRPIFTVDVPVSMVNYLQQRPRQSRPIPSRRVRPGNQMWHDWVFRPWGPSYHKNQRRKRN
jgi:hypothetical protein